MRNVSPLRVLLPVLAVLALLAGCEKYPSATTDGSAWDTDWTILGDVMGVEDPGHGFTLQNNNTAPFLRGRVSFLTASALQTATESPDTPHPVYPGTLSVRSGAQWLPAPAHRFS